jgi:hypothetical protein
MGLIRETVFGFQDTWSRKTFPTLEEAESSVIHATLGGVFDKAVLNDIVFYWDVFETLVRGFENIECDLPERN